MTTPGVARAAPALDLFVRGLGSESTGFAGREYFSDYVTPEDVGQRVKGSQKCRRADATYPHHELALTHFFVSFPSRFAA